MTSKTGKIIASVPHFSKLCVFNCQPQFERIKNSICKTQFHANVLTCRYVINELPDTIGTPTKNGFILIIRGDFNEIQKVKHFLKSIHVDFSSEAPVTLGEYESCLKYTIEFKMVSSWDKIGNYFIYEKNCLQNDIKEISAINLDILVTCDEILIDTSPLILRKFILKLEDIVDSKVAQNFLINPDGIIDIKYIKHIPLFVTVIPSLQRARIISISKRIPKDCPFLTYSDICSHWKNMYGFFLPKNSDEIFYYTVSFPYFPNKTFIYPNVCVFNAPPQVCYGKMLNVNLNEIFFFDFQRTITHICGQKVDIVNQANLPYNINDYFELNNCTPNNRLMTIKKAIQKEPLSGKFTFKVLQDDVENNENDYKIQNNTKSEQALKSNSETKSSLNNNIDTSKLCGSTELNINKSPTKSFISKERYSSKKLINYKSIIPNTPHISQFFQEKKFKKTNIKGLKMGQEINRKNEFQHISKVPQSFKPLFSSVEIKRKDTETNNNQI